MLCYSVEGTWMHHLMGIPEPDVDLRREIVWNFRLHTNGGLGAQHPLESILIS